MKDNAKFIRVNFTLEQPSGERFNPSITKTTLYVPFESIAYVIEKELNKQKVYNVVFKKDVEIPNDLGIGIVENIENYA